MTQVDCENLQKLRCQPSSFQACPSEIGRTSSALASCPTFFFFLLELLRSLFLGAVLNVMELGQTKFPGRFPMSKMAIRTWGPGACRDVGVLGQRILYKDGYDILCPSI